MNRREIMLAFKDHPKIIEEYAKLWYSEVDCLKCGISFVKKQHNQRYCSIKCREQKIKRTLNCSLCSKPFVAKSSRHAYCSVVCQEESYRQKRGSLRRKQQKAFDKASKKKFLTELKTVECSFCSVEYEQHKSSKSKFCCDFCRKSARKFKE